MGHSPAKHLQEYASAGSFESVLESEQVPESSRRFLPLLHGLLAHSSTSSAQLPELFAVILSLTLHRPVNSLMNAYPQRPFAKPATHVHWYA